MNASHSGNDQWQSGECACTQRVMCSTFSRWLSDLNSCRIESGSNSKTYDNWYQHAIINED